MLASQNEEYKKFMSSPPPSATGVPNNSSSSKSSADQKSSQPHIPLTKPPKVKVEWSTGLCDCFSDIPNCCVTCWCPCITFGRISEIVDKGSSYARRCEGFDGRILGFARERRNSSMGFNRRILSSNLICFKTCRLSGLRDNFRWSLQLHCEGESCAGSVRSHTEAVPNSIEVSELHRSCVRPGNGDN